MLDLAHVRFCFEWQSWHANMRYAGMPESDVTDSLMYFWGNSYEEQIVSEVF